MLNGPKPSQAKKGIVLLVVIGLLLLDATGIGLLEDMIDMMTEEIVVTVAIVETVMMIEEISDAMIDMKEGTTVEMIVEM